MAKLSLTDVASGYALITTLNANNTLIETALENTLSRDGTTPNTMSDNLDLNSNRVTNLSDATNNQDAVSLAQLTAATVVASSITAALVSLADASGDYTATTAEAAFAELAATTGAAIIGVLDSGANFAGADVEAVLAELQANIDALSFLSNVSEDTTPQLGGALDCNSNGINMGDQIIDQPVLRDFGIENNAVASSSAVAVYDLETGNSFTTTLTEDITTVTLSNPPASGTMGEIIIKFIQDGTGSWTVTWPASVQWQGGTGPTITTTATTGTDLVTLKTFDGGTIWYGDYGQDYS